MTALAIVDDIGDLTNWYFIQRRDLIALAVATILLFVMFYLNHYGIESLSVYLFSHLLWYTIFIIRIHATLAILAALLFRLRLKQLAKLLLIKSKN